MLQPAWSVVGSLTRVIVRRVWQVVVAKLQQVAAATPADVDTTTRAIESALQLLASATCSVDDALTITKAMCDAVATVGTAQPGTQATSQCACTRRGVKLPCLMCAAHMQC